VISEHRHQPVLVEEVLRFLAARPGVLVVDGTVGEGGHAEAILEASGPDGRLLGIDRDDEALAVAEERLRRFGARVTLVRASFGELGSVLEERGIHAIDGLLLDLGISSRQLDDPRRGFRFDEATAAETPLDMRMDRRLEETAADLLASASEVQLADWFRRYGELPGARRLARAVVETRRKAPLRSAADLVALVRSARVGGGRRHHPATLVFQALRIAVNDELGALTAALEAGTLALAPGGRMVAIAYHSLEDRAVKQCFRDLERGCICPPALPVCRCGRRPMLRRLTRRPVTASESELSRNPRARSARLRAAERLEAAA
jgi:16S rRNA (cytosine1402-N4)-methyltransferase